MTYLLVILLLNTVTKIMISLCPQCLKGPLMMHYASLCSFL